MDDATVKTFHTNLVLLPMVMVYMQYCFLALGLATALGAVLLHYRGKVRPLQHMVTAPCLCGWERFVWCWMGESESMCVHKTECAASSCERERNKESFFGLHGY